MNPQTFPPLMHSPQIMSTQQLQSSPFAPDQFLTRRSHPLRPASPFNSESNAESLDEDIFSPHGFIKKRPLEVTEDLVEGRVETFSQRLRRCRSPRAVPRILPELSGFTSALDGVEPMTPPNRSRSPISLVPRDRTLPHDAERLRHSSQARRKSNSRRSAKIRRSCTGAPSRSSTRESPPVRTATRSPLGRWTPPTMTAFQHFSPDSPDLPTTPPPRLPSAYLFSSSDHSWSTRIPWTITSPSSSPYPSHSPPANSQHQA